MADDAKPNLYGWGTYLNRDIWSGENAASGLDDFLTRLQAYDPDAHIVHDQVGESGTDVQRIVYDNTKLPNSGGYIGSSTELNNVYGDQGTGGWGGKLLRPGLTRNEDVYGRSTDNSNVMDQKGLLEVLGPLAVGVFAGGLGGLAFASGGAGSLVSGLNGLGSGLSNGNLNLGSILGMAGNALGIPGSSAISSLLGMTGVGNVDLDGPTTGPHLPGGPSGVSSDMDPRLLMLLALASQRGG